jgi:hypothetical protein
VVLIKEGRVTKIPTKKVDLGPLQRQRRRRRRPGVVKGVVAAIIRAIALRAERLQHDYDCGTVESGTAEVRAMCRMLEVVDMRIKEQRRLNVKIVPVDSK